MRVDRRAVTRIVGVIRREQPLRPGGYLVVSMQKVWDGYAETLTEVRHGADRIQTLGQLDGLYAGLERVSGFEPAVGPDEGGHTLAAYRKPDDRAR